MLGIVCVCCLNLGAREGESFCYYIVEYSLLSRREHCCFELQILLLQIVC